jgi:hypothetical protein
MTNKEVLQKQAEEYRNELKATAENHDRMIQMANQQAVKIEQLRGAIAALERLLKEEAENGRVESPSNDNGKIAS